MKHALFERASETSRGIAIQSADWLLDAIAASTQDRRFLRGEKEYDEMLGEAILACGIVACLRAMEKSKEQGGV